jgi:hypothetical protein
VFATNTQFVLAAASSGDFTIFMVRQEPWTCKIQAVLSI